MNKKIIIADILSNTIDGKSTGHYFALARNYLEIFGNDCLVAGGPVYKDAFPEDKLYVLPNNNMDGSGRLKLRLRTFANARKLFKEAKGNIIVLQQCTTITTFLCIILFYRKKNGRLFLIQYSLEGFRNILGRFFYKLAKRKIDGLICPNNEVGEAYQIPYCVVPDYIYTGENRIENMDYEEKKYDFCMVGRISKEKGVPEVVRYFANTPYKVIIAGRPTSKELEDEVVAASKNVKNVTTILDFVSEEDFRKYLRESRYAILNYQGEYSNRSSGVVYDNIFSGVPIIGKRCKALNFIGKYGIGYLYDSIKDFAPQEVLDYSKYEEYQSRIMDYRKTHEDYKKKLAGFLFS